MCGVATCSVSCVASTLLEVAIVAVAVAGPIRTELLNTAIEEVVDAQFPNRQHNEHGKNAKDIACAATFISLVRSGILLGAMLLYHFGVFG